MRVLSSRSLTITTLALALCVGSMSAEAQLTAKQTRGFRYRIQANATGEELTSQPDMWALEVSLKPMRMIWVEMTDPQTGRKQRELIWYLVYKIVNRELTKRPDTSDTAPVNDVDQPPEPVFAPELTLVTDDHGVQEIYHDVVLPEAQQAIVARERRELMNSVEIAGPLPGLTPRDSRTAKAHYGVAMWRNVDPTTDHFRVFLNGFCSAYKLGKGPDGEPLTLRRTIELEYDRRGDEFDEFEKEIELKTEPTWVYRPDSNETGSETVATREQPVR